MNINTKELASVLVAETKAAIARAVEPLQNNIKAQSDTIAALELVIEGLKSIEAKNGLDGKDGANGSDGADGQDGATGEKGLDGRDALELDILPSIDPLKRYGRKTYAQHDGGIVFAVRQTEPLGTEGDIIKCGWAVAVQGVAETAVEQVDEQTFSVKSRLTGGGFVAKQFVIPAMIYKGVYTDGTEYKRGHTATWASSTWHCNAEKTTDKPGTSDAWQLVVRKGKDGKDGTNGKDFTAPVRLAANG